MKIIVFILTDRATKAQILKIEKKLQDPKFSKQILRSIGKK